MTDAFDLIISKKGYNWDDSDIRNIDFHSSMALPQAKTILTGYLDFDPGDTKKTLTLPHGLSFTPWYFPYFRNNTLSQEMMLPIFPTGIEGIGFPKITSHVNGTNVVFDVDFEIGWNVYQIFASDLWSTWYDDNSAFTVGRSGSSGKHGAMRFENIPLSSSTGLTQARILAYVGAKDGSTSSHMRWHTYGIKEVNTQSFNNPMDRTRTTAVTNIDRTVPVNYGDYVEMFVTNQVNEIRALSGWTTGNAMGFTMVEDGSDNDAIFGEFTPSGSYIELTLSGTLRLYFKAVVLTEKIV